jgi:hypothetical protein
MTEQEKYIAQRMAEFAMNIDEFSVDQVVLDTDGAQCVIVDKSTNSIKVAIGKKSKNGIDTTQWFAMGNFNKRFKTL